MRNCRRIVILRFLNHVARKNCGADSYWPSELLAIEFDRLSLKIKAFTRASTGQQRAIIGDMADHFYVCNIQKFWRRYSNARRWRSKTCKSAGAYQREQS